MRKLGVLVAALAVITMTVMTARPASAQDAKAILQAASKAMGSPKTIQMTGTGWNAAVGQSFTQEEDWPRFEVTRYVRTIDYDAVPRARNSPAGRETIRRAGRRHTASRVSNSRSSSPAATPRGTSRTGNRALSQGQYLAGVTVAEFRRLDIALTPHGFLRAAMAATNPTRSLSR
jgi:hypothetical protein